MLFRIRLDSCQLQKRGIEIDSGNGQITNSGSGDASRPANDERLPDAAFLQFALATAEGCVGCDPGFPTIVAREDENYVVRAPVISDCGCHDLTNCNADRYVQKQIRRVMHRIKQAAKIN